MKITELSELLYLYLNALRDLTSAYHGLVHSSPYEIRDLFSVNLSFDSSGVSWNKTNYFSFDLRSFGKALKACAELFELQERMVNEMRAAIDYLARNAEAFKKRLAPYVISETL